MGDVEVAPSELKFRFQSNKQLLATITLNNPNDRRVAFKIKTTAPKKYVVRPSSGICEAASAVSVQVIMQAQKELPADYQNVKDKFMVQTTTLDDDEQIDKDTFTKEARKDLKETRLRVTLEGPASPPSPVPEANEMEDADGARGDAAGAPRSRAFKDDLSHATAEINALRDKLERVTKDRDSLSTQLDMIKLQGGHPGGAGGAAAAAPHDSALKLRATMIHFILVAIIAFLIGHYT